MVDTSFARLSQLMALAAGGIATALGLAGLVGWYTGSVLLVQFAPTLAPMQYNSALSFMLSGAGLLALTIGRSRLGLACGIVVAAIGSLTLVEYLLGIDLGIDQLFMRAYITVQTSEPGRMGPNTALCFALTGINLLVVSRATRHERVLLLIGLLGSIVLALGLVAVIGYLTGLKTYGWGYFTDMAPQEAFGCMALGGGVIAFAWRTEATPHVEAQPRLAVLVGIGGLTVTLCLWQTLIASEEARVERVITLAKANVHNGIMTHMEAPVLSLVRMAGRWQRQGQSPWGVWEDDAQAYVSHYPGMQAVAWVDPSYRLRWIVPPEVKATAQDSDLEIDGQQRSTLELARNSRQVTATGTLDLPQGGKGFQVYVPLTTGPDFDGFIVGIFRTQDLFDDIVTTMALPYSIAVFEGGKEIYGRYDAGKKHERKWGQETAVGIYGVTWSARIWPTPALLAEELSPLPEVVLAVGLFTDVLLMLALYLAHVAQRRATQVDTVNQALQNEVSEHTQTETLLAARIRQTEAVRAVTMEITRELDLTSLLSLITRRAIELVDAAQSGAVYLWDESTQVLVPHAWHGRGDWMQRVRIHLGEGIVGTVAQRQHGILANDYPNSPYAQPRVVEYFGSTAVIAEPLLYRDRLVGVIVLDNRGTTRLFTTEDCELLTLFAAHAAVAIENARLYETLEKRFTRLQTLTRLNQLISSSLDISQVLGEIARAAAMLMDASVVSFWLVDETTRTLEVRAFSDESIGADFPTRTVSFGQGGVGWVAQHRRPLSVTDVFTDDRFIALDWWRRHHLCCFFGLPILHEGTLLAVLSLNGRLPFRFGPDDQSLLESFVAQTAVAFRNARLFAEIGERTAHLAQVNDELHTEVSERRRAEEALQHQTGLVKLLQSAAVAANEATTIEEAMQTVVDQICAYTGWPVGHVYVVDEDTLDDLRPTAIWHLQDRERFETFRQTTEATRLTRGQGLPGRVLASGKAAWITDVTLDPNFPRATATRDLGVRAGFAFPVPVGTAVAAVLEFFSDEAAEPDAVLLESMTHIGTQLGRVVERQHAEEALRASEVRFRSVVRAANDAIVLGDSQGRIITWNQGAESIFGYTEAEVLGQPLTILMPARYRVAHQRAVDQLMRTGQPRLTGKTLEFHGLRKDGSEFPLEMSLATWESGGSTFCSGIIRDITERKQALEQLQRQQEALYQREKLAAMGSLLASVAHELNNPLSVVMVQAELLSLELKDEPLVERIKAMSQSAERCVHLVRNFLALARQNPPQRSQVSLNAVVEDVVELLSYTLRVDNIDLIWRPAQDLPPLWADQHQLHQVVVNLVTNAHQALRDTAAPRRLMLTTRHDPARRQVSLEVADTGPGIPPALRERIFEPFFTTKPPGIGTGLGLPFCQGIIAGHGGTISVESQPGHGAVFRVDLPVEAVPAPAPETPPPQTSPSSAGKTILVVDDEPGITSALAYLLRRDGHRVDTAAHGRQALERLQHRDYDLILCDLRMPELDGPGFYAEMTRSHPHLRQRVIFLTGDTLSQEAQEFLARVGVSRLSKPFRAAEVRQAIQQALHTT
ncbi:MAG TPA: GAF domain-containing protein [Candidatus Tectomicrobia bacterium]|nr:GAF domain-containing protein [Candidatus Tectomicrobia bacterium]